MAMIDRPEAARRLARAIASDLALYNEDKIVLGLKNDTFFKEMEEEITEGRELYEARVSPDLRADTNYFERALIDIIIKPKSHIKTPIW